MSERKDEIGRGYQIAAELEAEGYDVQAVSRILSYALGIGAEGIDGSHRNLTPLLDGMLSAAQLCFDALRTAREQKPS